MFGEILFSEVARSNNARRRNSSPAGDVDQVVPRPPIQVLVVHVREDVLVPLGVVPVQAHLVRPAVRPTHVRVVDGSTQRPRQKAADKGVVDPEELNVERHAVHGDGHVSREDVAHPGAVWRIEVIRHILYRDVPLAFSQDVHAPKDITSEDS